MSISIKTYFNVGQSDAEIRRFSVDSDASTSFEYLMEKIRNVYPKLKRASLRLFWKDEDGELITFSSDDELIEALTHVNGEFFRVYIKEECKNGSSNGDEKVHNLVTCDGCDGAVVGSRFKCLICPDYDLCAKCESKGEHGHHHMLRIRNPGQSPQFPPWFIPPWGGRGGCGGRRGGPRRGFPGFRRGWGWQCPTGGQRQSQQQGQGTSTTDTQSSGMNEPGTAFFHQFGETLNSFLGPFGVDVHTYVDDEAGKQGECGQHDNSTTTCPTAPPQEEGEKMSENDGDEEPMQAQSPSEDHNYVVVNDPQDVNSPEKKLHIALEMMKNMGFDNDGGWLTQLLKAKNYDINKVLDAIQPQKRH